MQVLLLACARPRRLLTAHAEQSYVVYAALSSLWELPVGRLQVCRAHCPARKSVTLRVYVNAKSRAGPRFLLPEAPAAALQMRVTAASMPVQHCNCFLLL